jgi:MFS family permease
LEESLPERASWRSWYTLALLWVIFLLSCMDRSVLAILVQPVKAELQLTDLQMGILTGFAFSIVYAICSIPVSRLADRGYRHRVIWIALIVWGIFSASCGLARSFLQLVICRFGVGGAEAGVSPSSQSIVYESFPPRLRNTASAIFQSGGATGILLAFALGGWLESRVGWRMTFVIVSLPSLLLAGLFLLTIPNTQPRRAAALGERSGSFRELLANPYFRLLCLASGLQMILLNGLPQWLPAYIERSYHVPRAQVGGMIAATSSTGMMLGIILAGPVADWLSRWNPLWPVRLMLISAVLVAFPAIGMFAVRDLSWVYPMMAATGFLVAIPAGLVTAMMQHSVRADQRASAAAGIILTTSLIGTGLVPALVGFLSDLYAHQAGEDSLRRALLTVVSFAAPALSWVFYRVYRLQAQRISGRADSILAMADGRTSVQ